jgi:hypothetical protein
MRRSSGGGSSTALRRLGRHDDYFVGLPPGDDDGFLDGVPPEDVPPLAELLLHCPAIEVCRLESLGERLCRPGCDDDRAWSVVDEVHRRAVEHVASGGSLAELRSRLGGLRRATWRWSRPLPPGPGDGPTSVPARWGGTTDAAPTDPRWLVDGLFPGT